MQANDTISGNVDVTVTVEGTVDIWVPGVYDLTYSAKDAANNATTVTRRVTVSFDKFVFEDRHYLRQFGEFVVNGSNLESTGVLRRHVQREHRAAFVFESCFDRLARRRPPQSASRLERSRRISVRSPSRARLKKLFYTS
ncbi:MAG: DUF5011 domain-containing protein [Bacillus subtilis]|nr:DUF5011 domain-containing protein [Bacillus subtilis]